MSAEAIIKSQARNILKHNFVKAIIALAILTLPLTIIDGTTTITSFAVINLVSDEATANILVYVIGYPIEIIMGFLFSPIINGYIRAFYRAAYSNTIDLRDVFYYFNVSRYIHALSLNIRLAIRMLLPVLLCYLPLITFDIISSHIGADFTESTLSHNLRFLLTVLSTVLVVLWSIRYFTVFTVSIDNEQLTPQQVFAYNKYIMQNRSGNVIKLLVSFIPWMLLCLLVLPMLYVIPYMTQSLCVSAKWTTKAAIEVN